MPDVDANITLESKDLKLVALDDDANTKPLSCNTFIEKKSTREQKATSESCSNLALNELPITVSA